MSRVVDVLIGRRFENLARRREGIKALCYTRKSMNFRRGDTVSPLFGR
jgi:hypothetical protein